MLPDSLTPTDRLWLCEFGSDSSRAKMNEQQCSDSQDAALMGMYSCIVDYACRHLHLQVIYEVSKHVSTGLSTLTVPHARLASASLYKMVVCDDVPEFSTAVQLAQCLFEAAGTFSNSALVCCYAKLLCGLKVKALFHCLQSSPKEALTLLRKYFSRHADELHRQLSLQNPALAKKIQLVSQDFQKCFLHLIIHKEKRELFMKREYARLYDQRFSQRLARRAARFVMELEKGLPDTFLDEVLKGKVTRSTPENAPTLWDVYMELLLDCVQGKTTLQSADLMNLLNDLQQSCIAPSQMEVRQSVLRMRLMSSSEGQSVSSGSSDSQRSCRTEVLSQFTVPTKEERSAHGHRVSGGVTTDAANQHLTDETSISLETVHSERSSRACVGCKQSRRMKLLAVHAHKYYGQRGAYVSPPCHVKLLYQKIYQDMSGSQHSLFV